MDRLDAIYPSEQVFEDSVADTLKREFNKDIRRQWMTDIDVGVNIAIKENSSIIPVEVNYWTEGATVEDIENGHTFTLPDDWVQEIQIYRFFWLIQLLERIVATDSHCTHAHVVFLTNDPYFLNPSEESVNQYQDGTPIGKFLDIRLSDGITVGQEPITWQRRRDWMIEGGAFDPIELSNTYEINWREYDYLDTINIDDADDFRYLSVKVKGQ